MAFFDLKIRIIDPTLQNRNTFKDILTQIGQPDVLLQSDARQLFNRDKPLPCDLVLINADAGYGLSAPDIIRYLTRDNLVPLWCKFVIVSQDPDYKLAAPIFRYLQTEIIHLPVDFQTLRYLTFRTITSLKLFKPILSKLHKISPAEMVKKVTSLKPRYKDPIVDDELLVMKLQLLMQAKQPDLARKLADKIGDPAVRFRELAYINVVTGQDDAVRELVSDAESKSLFLFGRVYLMTYLCVAERNYRSALRHFQKLPTGSLRGNDAQAYALLLQQSDGLQKALAFINGRLSSAPRTSMLYSSLVATKTKLLFVALATEQLDSLSKREVYTAVQELADHRIWQKGEFKYAVYGPFLELGLALHEGKAVAEEQFEQLYLQFRNYDISQLNVLLYAANKLEKHNASRDIHDRLEQVMAKVEVSPELISFLVLNDVVLRTSMSPERQKFRLEYLGLNHWQSGRYYRALTKFKDLISQFDDSPEMESQMRRLIKESGLTRYWRYIAAQ